MAPDIAVAPIVPKPPVDPLAPNPAVTTVKTPLTDTWKGAKSKGPVKSSVLATGLLTDAGSMPVVTPPILGADSNGVSPASSVNQGSTQPSATALRAAQQDGKPFIDPTGVM